MSLISSPLAVAPRIRVAPPAARNDAAEVIDLMAAYDVVFDDWQIDALRGRLRRAAMTVKWAAPHGGLQSRADRTARALVLIGRALAGAVIFR